MKYKQRKGKRRRRSQRYVGNSWNGQEEGRKAGEEETNDEKGDRKRKVN